MSINTIEIHDMFAEMSVPSIPTSGSRWDGYHIHEFLNTSKLTTKDAQSDAVRKAKRADLERSRRAYKTAKQREYDRAKAIARRLSSGT